MDKSKQKQWWVPVWKGLVVDQDGKHHRRMKSAVWLYLYLLVHANRATGVLMRKTRTIMADMGVNRDMVVRWLNVLRKEGYIETLSTGHSLTIRIRKWKTLWKTANTQQQMSDKSDTRSWKYPTPAPPPAQQIPLYFDPKLPLAATPNDTNINIIIKNDMQQNLINEPSFHGFRPIGSLSRHESLAWELATALDDTPGINLYRSYAQRYPEWLLRKAVADAKETPAHKIRKGRGALFTYLVQLHAKGTTENSGR